MPCNAENALKLIDNRSSVNQNVGNNKAPAPGSDWALHPCRGSDQLPILLDHCPLTVVCTNSNLRVARL